ncbi:MAG TPA: phosphoglycerate kinase [Candidatus Dormibacteraeota bacterium]|nr:phosphoglycerate kinase [Candidatus Dormibacteraeota bacterium]
MARFLTLRDLQVRGKRVLVREDLNVPLKEGAVRDDTRIRAAVPTLRYLREHGARTVIVSHLGRPEGQRKPELSLRPVAEALSKALGAPVQFCDQTVGPTADAAVAALRDGEIVLLENVRFDPGEEANDPAFAAALAKHGDLYVNDAFGTAHRAHASTAGVAADLPAAAGFLMEAELQALFNLLNAPAKPFICVLGGAKVADKIGVFMHLMQRCDAFVVGGGMANTFLAAQGVDVGASLRDKDLSPAHEILARARAGGVTIHLPVDAVAAASLDAPQEQTRVVDVGIGASPLRDGEMLLDIGPKTRERYERVVEQAKTIVFNGPMGVYEKTPFQRGTAAVGEAIAAATAAGAVSVVGGGDAAAAAHALGFADRVTHVSTGGGATLEFLEGRELPGVAALEKAAVR